MRNAKTRPLEVDCAHYVARQGRDFPYLDIAQAHVTYTCDHIGVTFQGVV